MKKILLIHYVEYLDDSNKWNTLIWYSKCKNKYVEHKKQYEGKTNIFKDIIDPTYTQDWNVYKKYDIPLFKELYIITLPELLELSKQANNDTQTYLQYLYKHYQQMVYETYGIIDDDKIRIVYYYE